MRVTVVTCENCGNTRRICENTERLANASLDSRLDGTAMQLGKDVVTCCNWNLAVPVTEKAFRSFTISQNRRTTTTINSIDMRFGRGMGDTNAEMILGQKVQRKSLCGESVANKNYWKPNVQNAIQVDEGCCLVPTNCLGVWHPLRVNCVVQCTQPASRAGKSTPAGSKLNSIQHFVGLAPKQTRQTPQNKVKQTKNSKNNHVKSFVSVSKWLGCYF